jgi:hypothetical protein
MRTLPVPSRGLVLGAILAATAGCLDGADPNRLAGRRAPARLEFPAERLDFGALPEDYSYEHRIPLLNRGEEAAKGIQASLDSGTFTFKGGTFPGAGGDCGSTLEGGASCDIVVESLSPSNLAYEAELSVGYTSAGETAAASLVLMVLGLAQLSSADGLHHTCGLFEDGRAYCCGPDTFGEVGDDPELRREPAAVPAALAEIALEVKAGDYHSCARLADGTVQCWGRNHLGQVDGTGQEEIHPVPVRVPGITRATAIDLQGNRSCAATDDQGVVCWGS